HQSNSGLPPSISRRAAAVRASAAITLPPRPTVLASTVPRDVATFGFLTWSRRDLRQGPTCLVVELFTPKSSGLAQSAVDEQLALLDRLCFLRCYRMRFQHNLNMIVN